MNKISSIKSTHFRLPITYYRFPNPGFTLIEILVIVVMLSLISFVSFLAYQQFLDKQKLQQTTELIISHTQDAQNNSVLIKNGSKYGIVYQNNQLQQFTDQPSQINSTYQFPSAVTLNQINLTNLNHQATTQITFAKLTGQPDAQGQLMVQSQGLQTVITISPSGYLSASEIIKK